MVDEVREGCSVTIRRKEDCESILIVGGAAILQERSKNNHKPTLGITFIELL